MSASPDAPPAPVRDPTDSEDRRERFARRFQARWRDARGDVRRLLRSDRHYRPTSERTKTSVKLADFREWLEGTLDEAVLEPAPHRAVRRGRHWTAPFVRDLYVHGIEVADRELERAGWEFDAPSPQATIRRGEHADQLAAQYVETYQDVEDAVRAAERDATRAYREAVRVGEGVRPTTAAVNDRLDKVGRNRTDLVAQAKAVLTINIAAVTRYEQVGVEELGVRVETRPGDDDGGDSAEAASRVEALQPTSGVGDADHPHMWRTAGDDRVCPQCRLLAGNIATPAAVRSGDARMPVRDTHPGCRCLWVPTGSG